MRRFVNKGAAYFFLCFALVSCLAPKASYLTKTENQGPTTALSGGDSLRIMTWNIKFGGGRLNFALDCFDTLKNIPDNKTAVGILDTICTIINDLNPDILLLQEVDVFSTRTQYINQVSYILNHTALKYGVYSQQWSSRPARLFWESRRSISMNTGNAILSKAPIAATKIIPLKGDRFIRFKRHAQQAFIVVNTDTICVINLHAPLSERIKKGRSKGFKKIIKAVESTSQPVIVGGDFNAVVPGAKMKGFTDAICCGVKARGSNYTKKARVMDDFYGRRPRKLMASVSLLDCLKPEHNTCSLNEHFFWSRKIDYLFSSLEIIYSATVQERSSFMGLSIEPMRASDHAPLVMIVRK